METLMIDEKLHKLINELEFKDAKEVIKDSLITEILYRISKFSEEVERFKNKYGKNLMEFKKNTSRDWKILESMMISWHGNLPNKGTNIGIINWKN